MKNAIGLTLTLILLSGCASRTRTTTVQSEPPPQPRPKPQSPIVRDDPTPHPATRPTITLEGPYLSLLTYDFDKSRAPLSAIEDEIRHASPDQYPPIEDKLLAALANPQTPFAAKQFICRMLERVGGKESATALAPLLDDAKLSHMARFALERMPNPAATTVLHQQLDRAKGAALVGIVTSLGQRRDAQSIDKLTTLAQQPDPDLSRAATEALGRIGTVSAARALENLAAKSAPPMREKIAEARIICARQLVRDGRRQPAIEIYNALASDNSPDSVKVAAQSGLLALMAPASGDFAASTWIFTTLEEGDEPSKLAALAALTPDSSRELRDAVANAIPNLKKDTQLRLLTVVADQRDVNLRPALKQIIEKQGDQSVRSAAIEALTTHGTAEDVALLLPLATKNSPEAKKTLQQMGAPGVDDALIALADKGDKDARVMVIRTLAARNAKSAVPVLLKIISGDDPALAGEASAALGVVGGSEHLPPLTEIVLTTDQAPVRASAQGALQSICARTPDKESCANTILPALQSAKTPQARISLLRVLSRLPIDKSLAALTEATKDQDEKVRDAAIRELADWPNIAAAEPLLLLAHGDDQTHAILALRGYIRLAGLKDRPASERIAMYQKALQSAARAEEKKAALAGLGDVPSIEALEILQQHLADNDLKSDAAISIVRLAKLLGASQNARMTTVLTDLRSKVELENIRAQIDDGIKDLQEIAEKTQGFIVAWMTAGPYTQAGKNGSALFDIAFAPEKNEKADWKPLIRPTDAPDLWMLDLHKILGPGNERVAYLKTTLNSPREQKAQLEIGSDDGVKVWLNGKLVHANNAARPLKQADDKVKIDLKQGSNTLLMKITQGGGDWAACARLSDPTGKKIPDVQINAE